MKRYITLFALFVFILFGTFAGTVIGSRLAKPNESITSVGTLPVPTQTSQVQGITQTYGIPSKLIVPKLGIHTVIESVGLDTQDRMDVPKKAENVGWYNLGVRPGEVGSAVFAGHYDTVTGAPAVFYNLQNLKPGDTITVIDDSGKEQNFEVTRTTSFPDSNFPIDEVFAQNDARRLNLITCGGVWDKQAKNYTNRTVVFTELKE